MGQKFWLALVLTAVPVLATAGTWRRNETSQMVAFQGRFSEPNHGYSVQAPPHGTGYVMDHVSADRSFLIIFGDHREVTVFPFYAVMDPRPTPCEANQLPSQAGQIGPMARIVLDGIAGCRVKGRDGNVVRDMIEAEKSSEGTPTMFMLQLTTTRRAAAPAERSFSDIVRSFRFIPVPQ